MKKTTILASLCTLMLLASCSTPKNFNYLQDLSDGQEVTTHIDGSIRLQPGDQATIIVKSKDPLMSSLFNKGISSGIKAGQVDGNIYLATYIVSPEGTIDIPVLGQVAVGGMNRYEAEQALQSKLREEQLKDANVTLELSNLTYTVMGEVALPGVYPIKKDATTIFEALGQAGDMGVFGQRDSVLVVRDNGKTKKTYRLSMNSGKDLLTSEAYYVRQNDVIYVKANNVKARQSTANGNETRSISFWLSIVSVLTSVAILIFK